MNEFLKDWRFCLVGALLFLLSTIFNGSFIALVYSGMFYYLAIVHFEDRG